MEALKTSFNRAFGGYYIISPRVDWICLIAAPLVAVLVTLPIGMSQGWNDDFFADSRSYNGQAFSDLGVILLLHGILSMSHIYVTVYRSHFNQEIFYRTPYRLTIVPICLICVFYYVPLMLAFGIGLALMWGYYHYAMQSFGIARIYDKKRGNDGTVGRWADYGLFVVLFIGPLLAGVNMWGYAEIPKDFALEMGWNDVVDVLNAANNHKIDVSRWVMIIGCGYLAFYSVYYYRLLRAGYLVSWQKYTMVVVTAVFNIVVWGFFKVGLAYFINELYHAVQYLVFVWFYERKNVEAKFGGSSYKKLALAAAMILTFSGGFWIYISTDSNYLLGVCVVQTCLLMHYWWDGFIWSVRRKQV